MKILLISALFSSTLFAQYQKPELLARYSGFDSWNARSSFFCFSAEPLVTKKAVYLNCQTENGSVLAQWSPEFSLIAEASSHRLFSVPKDHGEVVSWNEFDDVGVRTLFTVKNGELKKTDLKDLNPQYSVTDTFLPLSQDSWVYRARVEEYDLWVWKNNESKLLFKPVARHFFPPVTGHDGSLVLKTREDSLDERAPDKLWSLDGQWKLVLEDKDSNPSSRWTTFRHQMGVERNKIVFFGTDESGEGLFLLSKGKIQEIARTGKGIRSFDYFSPKLRGNVIVFRGVDSEKRKAVWVHTKGKLSKLVTQGDVVETDRGPAEVNYPDQDAIFYGAPGIGPDGEIVLQATLSKIKDPTLVGIGLLKFKKD